MEDSLIQQMIERGASTIAQPNFTVALAHSVLLEADWIVWLAEHRN